MNEICIFPVGTTPACRYALEDLQRKGLKLTDHPSPEVSHLLLDVPSFRGDGQLRGGGDIEPLLQMLPEDLTVIGGQLCHPALDRYRTLDLLRHEGYLAKNAAITADCALKVAAPLLETTFRDTRVLIFGWGRIGKCLAALLKALGAEVTVAARKEQDRGMLEALGYRAVDTEEANAMIPKMGLIFNTVPQRMAQAADCVAIDLASVRGLTGETVVWARGLPGIHAPKSTGQLTADTILDILKEESK